MLLCVYVGCLVSHNIACVRTYTRWVPVPNIYIYGRPRCAPPSRSNGTSDSSIGYVVRSRCIMHQYLVHCACILRKRMDGWMVHPFWGRLFTSGCGEHRKAVNPQRAILAQIFRSADISEHCARPFATYYAKVLTLTTYTHYI